MMTDNTFPTLIAQKLGIQLRQVEATLRLLADGATVPFIARYRKEATGSLDEVQIEEIRNQHDRLNELAQRKQTILRTIEEQGRLTDELRQSIASVKSLYPGRRLLVAFQPHLYSRTRDFAPQFAEALSAADQVLLIDIYPARELPIPGVTSKIIFDDIKCDQKMMISKEKLPETVKSLNFDILLTVGAGDINLQLPAVVRTLRKVEPTPVDKKK